MSTAPLSDLMDALRAALAGQYDVERPLGVGGMGSVFLARDTTLDRPVAIKVISPELAASKPFRDRFLQEARTVAKLRHPNIVAVHSAGERDGLLYFVMEYVAGESLRELLDREGRCGGERGTTILHDLALALDYAHRQGVVHRDIKPENVLIEADGGRAMLTDFGVARALSGGDGRMTGTGFVVGSPRYMSPEQAAGERETDGRSDIYSLGLLGYEMFSGAPAFAGSTAASIIVKQMTEPPAPLSTRDAGVPPRVAAAIDRALEKDPALRWATGGEMARALEGTPVPGSYVSSATLAARRGSRRRAAAIAAVVLLAVGVPAAWLLVRGQSGATGDPRKSVLVAPFDVQSGDPSIRWLREGSVNMLALNMAQWNDLKVVNYERSLDLLRDAGLDDEPRIGLAAARDLARRAGVGTVVMGVVSTPPDSLLVRATLYDVASGRKLDEATSAAALRADPRSLYDQVARELLDLVGAPPLSLGVARTTTGSLDAYRSYLDGVRLLNGWRLAEADSAFRRAIAADSTFALAYYKRTLTLGWSNPFDPEHIRSAELAARHAERLPPRERELVGAYAELAHGLSAQQRGDTAVAFARLAEAERRYRALAARDPNDAEAWYGLGDAAFHQAKPNHDPSATFTRALRAFNRTLALDSTFHLAYSHKIVMYNSAGQVNSGLMLAGDSLYVLPDSAARRAFGAERFAAAKVQARALAVRDALHWVEVDPDAQQSHVALADTYTAAGFPDSAAMVLERALARPRLRAPDLAYRAASLQLAAGSPDALATLRRALDRYPADSLRRTGGYQRFGNVFAAANVAAAAGSLRDLRRVMSTGVAADPVVPFFNTPTESLARWYGAALQLGMGLPAGPLRQTIDEGIRYADTIPTMVGTNVQASSMTVPYVAYLSTRDTAYIVTARRWAKGMNIPSLTELDALAALQAGDTARAAALAREFPLPQPEQINTFTLAGLRAMTRAEVLIELGEAERAIVIYERLNPRRFTGSGLVDPGWALYPRSFLARAQVYEQLGDRAKAEAAYERFLELWKEADPALQPQLAQAREGLRRLRDAPPAARRVTR